ncbi:TPA: FkbM family methyltransferase [Candidatus Ventrenecus avicola]|nr:FkbM family methyltransferase [Candidatus Ventrenecus avicola]
MNELDKKMKELISELKLFSEKEIYEHIIEKLKMVPVDTQESISKFLDNFSFWGSFHPTENDFSTLERLSKFLKENSEKFEKMYQSLEDYRSKKIFYAILNNWYNYDFINLEQVMEKCFSHYFDLDIIPSCQEEVFVDLGAFTGDTIKDFIGIYGDNYKKIYAYEMTEQSMRELKERVKNYPRIIYKQKAVSDEVGMGSIKIHEISTSSNQLEITEVGELEVTSLDDDINEKITILKMDIEGSELKALKGAENHIIKDKPKLLLSVYHGYEELLTLWEYLEKLNLSYHYYLRYYGGPIFPTEIVLFAI